MSNTSSASKRAHHQHSPRESHRDEAVDDERLQRIRQRPDGYHWVDVEGRQEFGPFESLEDVLADMDGPGDEESGSIEAIAQGLDTESVADRGGEDEPEPAT